MRSKHLDHGFGRSMRRMVWASFASVGLLLAPVANATTLEGLSIDSNGAGLQSDGKAVRLIGVHFPSDPLLCGGDRLGCLQLAMDQVENLVGRGDAVRCEVVGISTTGTHLSSCRLGEDDLGSWLVERGLAFADRHISRRYVREERGAREARRGLWADVNFGSDEAASSSAGG